MDSRDLPSVQMIDGHGNFKSKDLENFAKQTRFGTRGFSFSVIAIMGPQSTGKSTLLNHLFDTQFKRMDASKGRHQVTEGIWLAPAARTEEFTLVMDVEGTDSRERQQNNDTFEKQTTLFAFVVSDLLMINMWTHDVGRVHAASKPLLKIVFEVILKTFYEEFKSRKTLIFVLRDYDEEETPLQELATIIREDAEKIEVVGLPHPKTSSDKFMEEVANLKKQLGSIAAGRLWSDHQRCTASEFSSFVEKFWKKIRENRDLDLHSYKFVMATVRCENIADKQYNSFINNQEWKELEEKIKSQSEPKFGATVTSMISDCLSRYDEEAKHYDEEVRTSKRELLEQRLLQVVQPSHRRMLRQISSSILNRFGRSYDGNLESGKGLYMIQFDREVSADATIGQAEWDCSEVREELGRSIDKHISAANMQSSLVDAYMRELDRALSGPVLELIERAGPDTWQNIRNLFNSEEQKVSETASTNLTRAGMDEERKNEILLRLKAHARSIVEAKAKEASGMVLDRLTNRFNEVFSKDAKSKRARKWGLLDRVEEHVRSAHDECLQVLCVLAAIRLDDDYDVIKSTLLDALGSSGGPNDSQLASDSWDEVPPSNSNILLTPNECKELWTEFQSKSNDVIEDAKNIITGKRTTVVLCTIAGLAAGGVAGVAAVCWAAPASLGMESAVAAFGGFGSTFLGSSTAAIANWFRTGTHNSSPSPVKKEEAVPASSEARSEMARMLADAMLTQALMNSSFPELSTQSRNQGHTIPGGVSKSRRVVRRTSRDIQFRTVQTEEIEECYDITISSREMLFDPLLQNNAARRLPPTLNAPSPRPALTL